MAPSTTTTRSSRSPANLLTLPTELRLQIYQYVLYPHYTHLDLPTAARRPLDHPLIHTTPLIRAESLSIYLRALHLHIEHSHALLATISQAHDDQKAEITNFPRQFIMSLYASGSGSSLASIERRATFELDMMRYRLKLLAEKKDVVRAMVEIEEKRVEVQVQKWGEWMDGE